MKFSILFAIFAITLCNDGLAGNGCENFHSAFGRLVKEHNRASGEGLVLRTEKAISVVECNLKCLKDVLCGGTNFRKLTNDHTRNCQLLRHDTLVHETRFETEEDTTYTLLERKNGMVLYKHAFL